VSPLHAIGEHSLSVHMIEHELLMAIAAPLLVLSRPIPALLWGLPRETRIVLGSVARTPIRGVWRSLTQPHAATVLHGAAIWAWHVPFLFQAALAHEGIHWLQHASFLGSAIMFWWALLRANRERAAYAIAVGNLFATSMHTGLLGALMVVSTRLFYVTTSSTGIPWNLNPLQDQQLAGLIMWVPGGLIYAGAAILFAGFLITGIGRKRGGLVHALPAE
jgi:putative membrane protein